MEKCNCKKNDIPRIVRGNDFTIVVNVERPVLGYKEKFDLRKCTDISVVIVSRFGRRITKPYVITDDGKLQVDFEEKTPAGLYGFEITGKDADGKDWRFYAKPGEWIEIVEATSDEYDPDNDGSKRYYDKTVEFGFITVSSELLAKMRLAVKGEEERVKAEEGRVDAEAKRQQAETLRAQAENSRKENEEQRIINDGVREKESETYVRYEVVDE